MVQYTSIILLIIGIFSLVPLTYSFGVYWRIRSREYLSFGVLWFSAIGSTMLNSFSFEANALLYDQIHETFRILFTFMMFHTALRMNDFRSEKRLLQLSVVGIVYSCILIYMVSQWQLIDQSSFKFLIPYIHEQSNLKGIGGGLIYNKKIIYSEGYNFIRIAFGILSGVFFVIVTFRACLMHPVPNVIRALNLWRISSIGIFLFHLGLLLSMFHYMFLLAGNICGLIGIFCVSVIVVKYPEGFLITKLQILRISHLYDQADKMEEEDKKFNLPFQDLDELIEYINQLRDIMDSY